MWAVTLRNTLGFVGSKRQQFKGEIHRSESRWTECEERWTVGLERPGLCGEGRLEVTEREVSVVGLRPAFSGCDLRKKPW